MPHRSNAPTLHHPNLPSRPLVWYVCAGYQVSAGIEVHVLHYATEMRNHGFETRVVVFKPLPAEKHRFLRALEERSIPIVSLYDKARPRARRRMAALGTPWFLYSLVAKRRKPAWASFRNWTVMRTGIWELRRLMSQEKPDLIHIFGRVATDAWREFPPERTIFHEMMTGTVDSAWLPYELDEYRRFVEKAARHFAPGRGVAANVRQEFGVKRNINVIFTMCPDERPETNRVSGVACWGDEGGDLQRPTPNAQSPNRTGRASDATLAARHPTRDTRLPSEARRAKEGHATRSLRFGVIFRLTHQKGITYLLEALREYRNRNGDVDFTFAGFGPLADAIRDFASKHGLANVRIQRVTTATSVLSNLDVFVHPSVNDAMPVAIAEALMCGLPCIVCNVGGCADLVRDGVEGFVIEPRRADLILDRMERFAAMSEGEFLEFRQRARARYEEVCRPESVGAIVAEHYRAVMAGG